MLLAEPQVACNEMLVGILALNFENLIIHLSMHIVTSVNNVYSLLRDAQYLLYQYIRILVYNNSLFTVMYTRKAGTVNKNV